MQGSPDPPLAPPRTGLPLTERLLGGIGIRTFGRLAPVSVITGRFSAEAHRVIELARSIGEVEGRTPVTIDRIPGIDEQSRRWSVYMTVEHLEIVNSEIAALLQLLCAERQPEREVLIDDVRPHTGAGPEQIEALASTVAHYGHCVAELDDLRTRTRHVHPWFGALSARQWHALAALHNRIHRTQIERILLGLTQTDRRSAKTKRS